MGKFLLFTLIVIAVPSWPDTPVMSLHDFSSHLSFDYFSAEGFRYGVEVINNVGPLGFLEYPTSYTGLHNTARLISQYVLAAVFALMALHSQRYFSTPARATAWIVLGCVLMEGCKFPLYLLLAGHYLLTREQYGHNRVLDLVVPILLAFMALMKSTYVPLAGAILGLYTVTRVWRGQWRGPLVAGGLFLFAFVAGWVLTGQRPPDLLAYLHATLLFAGGYNEVMGMDEHYVDTIRGVVALLLVVVVHIERWRRGDLKYLTNGLFLFEAFWLFVAWKHGFIRADDHMWQNFYSLFLVASPLLFLAHYPAPADTDTKAPDRLLQLRWGLLTTSVLLSLTFYTGLNQASTLSGLLGGHLNRIASNFVRPFTAGSHLERQHQRLEKLRAELDLPRTREVVGDATVDQFGYEPAQILLNGLNYKPRPMAINFGAFNRRLQELNRDYYRDPARRPAFVLTAVDTIDVRLAAQDDALALLALLRQYRPVHTEKNQLLLKAAPLQPPLTLEPVSTVETQLNEGVPLPDENPLWVRIDLGTSLLGRLRSTLYKPPFLFLELTYADGSSATYRYNPPGGRSGFLIRPLIRSNADLRALYGEAGPPAPPTVVSFKLWCKPGGEPFYAGSVHIAFDRLPGLSLSSP